MTDADVAVVIPTIPGREQLLARARASVDAQRLQPRQVITEYDVNRTGAAATRNRALEKVTTKWVAWLDDDDELLPWHIDALVSTGERTGADLVYSYAQFVGGRDPLATTLDGRLVIPLGVPFGWAQRRHLIERGNFIPVTNLIRTELVRRVGGFPEPHSFPTVSESGDCEDYGLLLRLLEAGATFVHEPVVSWRYHFHSSNTGGRREG